ncbi:adenylosuccinate synthetase [Sphingomonas hengshuiensis]|uniref:Adenylosuccinate synthase n=1 Tax=Sphingomonas hengshuiensis TaxID=1609977 RepID=A0A7U4JB02_9SPHN|nr:adenylosuccinate synthetase [Sphingomonas hengshuiensis]AJP73432.1 adenylosuccinate synthase [Sphingomonas hengshuiensis]
MRLLIVLSGPVAVGKTSFGSALLKIAGATRVSTRTFIQQRLGTSDDRGALQAAGDQLDAQTNGRWVTDAVAAAGTGAPADQILLLDSARIPEQVEALRSRWPGQVFHIHLHAEDATLERRYLGRPAHLKEFPTYDEVKRNKTEASVGALQALADLVLDTDFVAPDTLAITAMEWFEGDGPRSREALVDVIVGGQYGSEGKGNVCAHLAKHYGVLMRIGGPNAGHLVKEPEYKYVQLPSGTGSNKHAKILIGAGSTLWLPQLLREIMDQGLTPERLSIDPQAMVIDDEDRRLESSALQSISSTKQGVGAASARKIANRGDTPMFGPAVQLARDVGQLQDFIRDVRAELDRHFASRTRVLLEGTQGTLLSLHHGFWPSVTSRETSAAGCLSDAGISPRRVRKIIMVVRTYPIRVGGTSGWMGRNISMAELAERSGISVGEFRKVEKGTISGVERRIAEFDWAQIRRSAELNGATDIAITFADYLGIENREATSFETLNPSAQDFIRRLERVAGTPVTLISKAFALDGVIERGF